MIECSFEEEVELPGGRFRYTTCINKAEILITNDPCFGLCYPCAYKKLAKRVKELERDYQHLPPTDIPIENPKFGNKRYYHQVHCNAPSHVKPFTKGVSCSCRKQGVISAIDGTMLGSYYEKVKNTTKRDKDIKFGDESRKERE